MNSDAYRWCVYILECQNGSLYTGITTDIERRYTAHLDGRGARYTRAFPPQRLLIALPYPTRAAAARVEWSIKQLNAQAKRRWIRDHQPQSLPLPSVACRHQDNGRPYG